MKFLRAAGTEVLGLFVADWIQTAVIILILAGGWIALSTLGGWALIPLVLLLAGQLVWFARAEALRSRS
jgi:hypothetical protein